LTTGAVRVGELDDGNSDHKRNSAAGCSTLEGSQKPEAFIEVFPEVFRRLHQGLHSQKNPFFQFFPIDHDATAAKRLAAPGGGLFRRAVLAPGAR